MARRWLHSVDLETDADNRPLAEQALIALGQAIADGRVKVDASGITLEADVVDVDIEALTGDPGKTLADLYTALGLVAKEADGNLAAVKTSTDRLANIETYTGRIPAGPAQEAGNLLSVKLNTDKIPSDPAKESGHLAAIVKEHTPAARTPQFRDCLTAVALTPVALVPSSVPYHRAWVQAYKPAGGGGSPGGGMPTDNADRVFINHRGEAAWWTLKPGESMELPPNCDLYDFDVCAAVGGDGVVVMVET